MHDARPTIRGVYQAATETVLNLAKKTALLFIWQT